ncbi:MAG: hypothetical protein AB1489_07325 [Acidobacteriota bacterium]
MKTFYSPLLLTIGGNLLYHIGQKFVPKTANPLLVLIVVYTISLTGCAVIYCFSPDKSLVNSLKENNWSVLAIGFGAAIVELGYLLAYRMGWNISLASVTSSIAVTLLLIPIGFFLFRESLSVSKILGILFCVLGLMLVTQK